MSRTRRTALVLALFGLFVVASRSAHAAPITVDHTDGAGRTWASLAETTFLTWNQLNTACSQDGLTACTSNIGVIETKGWIWATRDQVRDLFYDLGLPAGTLNDSFESEASSTWAPAVLAAFAFTENIGANFAVGGLTSTLFNANNAYYGYVRDVAGAGSDLALLDLAGTNVQYDYLGAFLFQPAAVPEPATVLLLATAGTGFVLARRRRRR